MKTKNILTVAVVIGGLSIISVTQAHEGKHEEQAIDTSQVPAAVQQAAQTQTKGQNILRWEKEGANYEAVVNQNGKEMGITIDPSGKVLNRHEEAKEHKSEASKY